MPGSHLKYKFLESLQDGKDDTSVWICQYYLDNIYKIKKNKNEKKSENRVFSFWTCD